MATIVAIDPGLAHCGLAAIDTDGTDHVVRDLSVCVTEKALQRLAPPMLRDDRVQRARLVRQWMLTCMKLYVPAAIVIEDFGFLQQSYSTACLAMAYQAIVDAIDEHGAKYQTVPIVSANANTWRNELAGLAAPRKQVSTKGLDKSAALEAKKLARVHNRKLTQEREKRAHIEALRRVRGAQAHIDMMTAAKSVHVLDAIGLFCWGVGTAPVKGAIYG